MVDPDTGKLFSGAQLTILAFSTVFGDYGKLIVSVALSLFAFSTILGWEYYGEKALEYLIKKRSVIMTPAFESNLWQYIKGLLPKIGGVVLSDYGCGTITEKIKTKLLDYCQKKGIPTIVDSRYDIGRFVGVDYVKQNDAELAAAVGRSLPDEDALYDAAQELLQRLEAQGVLITRGEKGMNFAVRGAIVAWLAHIPERVGYDAQQASLFLTRVTSHVHNVPVVIDPKGSAWEKYMETDYITPNLRELNAVLPDPIRNKDESVEKAASYVMRKRRPGCWPRCRRGQSISPSA